VSYYAGDAWTYHTLNEVKCAECEEYFDDQEGEGNICPPCVSKSYGEGEGMTVICGDHLRPVTDCGCRI
jgi:Zn finger protein HypA/HybF involved in hydrogenase expression